jgi:DNA-binding transcriptional LysR family regulator
MLDLDLLRSFVSVVDTGGFTSAGERVHRTQSTVSQQIRRLEDGLGYPLLHRNGKQATPTEQGERLVSYARRILALEQEARDVVARPDSEAPAFLGAFAPAIPLIGDFLSHPLLSRLMGPCFSEKFSDRARWRRNSKAFQRKWLCGCLRSEPVLLNRLS